MLTSESLFPVPAAFEKVTGQRPHPTTVHRSRLRGVGGVKLETVRCGGRRLTSLEAVQRFIAGCTAAAAGEPIAPRTNRQREAAIAAAERELSKAGV